MKRQITHSEALKKDVQNHIKFLRLPEIRRNNTISWTKPQSITTQRHISIRHGTREPPFVYIVYGKMAAANSSTSSTWRELDQTANKEMALPFSILNTTKEISIVGVNTKGLITKVSCILVQQDSNPIHTCKQLDWSMMLMRNQTSQHNNNEPQSIMTSKIEAFLTNSANQDIAASHSGFNPSQSETMATTDTQYPSAVNNSSHIQSIWSINIVSPCLIRGNLAKANVSWSITNQSSLNVTYLITMKAPELNMTMTHIVSNANMTTVIYFTTSTYFFTVSILGTDITSPMTTLNIAARNGPSQEHPLASTECQMTGKLVLLIIISCGSTFAIFLVLIVYKLNYCCIKRTYSYIVTVKYHNEV